MSEIKKSELLVNAAEPLFIRHAANEKHNEVTVCVLTLAIPVVALSSCLNEAIIEGVKKVSRGFPDAKLRFNFKQQAPAFIFQVKGKTERRGEDVHDQEIADAIAMAKASKKACVIGSRVAKVVNSVLSAEAARAAEVVKAFDLQAAKEASYVDEEKYLAIREKRQQQTT